LRYFEDAPVWRAAVLQRQRTGGNDPDREGFPSLPQDRQRDARELATHDVRVRLVGSVARRQRQLGRERLYLRLDVRQLEVIGREQQFQLDETYRVVWADIVVADVAATCRREILNSTAANKANSRSKQHFLNLAATPIPLI
jgi:hypothetical protein